MKIFPLELTGHRDLQMIINKIGADVRSFPWFNSKLEIHCIYIRDISTTAANILKQEILSRGGDLLVSGNTVNCRDKTTDGLLIATEKQIDLLVHKLKRFDILGLDKIGGEISRKTRNAKKRKWKIPLPGDRPDLELDHKTKIMGIINLTPDSFYSRSRTSLEDITERAAAMISEGATVLDIGAESTRPGSVPVSAEEEIDRLITPLKSLRKAFPGICLSVDTYKSETARKAIKAGADIINDIYGLKFDPSLAEVAAEHGAALVIGHIQGTPQTMQESPYYEDTLTEVLDGLESSLDVALKHGMDEKNIILDPGLGFGKRYIDNLEILKKISSFRAFGLPLLIGHSRKGFIVKMTGAVNEEERLLGTTSVTSYCAMQEIQMVRVHDVAENLQAVKAITAIREAVS